MMEAIQHALYVLSNALLLPTLLGILVMAAWTMLLLGGLLREWFTRPAIRRVLREARHLAKHAPAQAKSPGSVDDEALVHALSGCRFGLPARLMVLLGRDAPGVLDYAKSLDDLENDVAASLAQLSWLTRVAPMLGLMGTLIPLGPALTGLASGDVAVLSSHLVVAFTATVIGVLIGCCSFTMGLVRKHWYQHDMGELEYIFSHVTRSLDSHSTPTRTGTHS
jgi:biopolymer transport protein ExbB/TolQ